MLDKCLEMREGGREGERASAQASRVGFETGKVEAQL